MANNYHKGRRLSARSPLQNEKLLQKVQSFLESCSEPALLEPGDSLLRLFPNQYGLEARRSGLIFEAWSEERNLSRRILAVTMEIPGVMECMVETFGHQTAKLTLLDLAKPQTASRILRGARKYFSSRFRQMLRRQFPGWEIEILSTEMNLTHSFSPSFPRALLRKDTCTIAALACPTAVDEPSLLSFGLIWHHYVSQQTSPAPPPVLALFIPDTSGTLTALRLRWLRTDLLRCRLFRFNSTGLAGEVDPADLGNLETHLPPRQPSVPVPRELQALANKLKSTYGTELLPHHDGGLSLRIAGFEFARIENGSLLFGLETKKLADASDLQEVEGLAAYLARARNAATSNRIHPLYRAQPERWLEAVVRRNIQVLDASLLTSPIYGQVTAWVAGDRTVVDLLAVSQDGRVSVIELKANEDVHLPMQSLDYWMRVSHHLTAGDFARAGFFPEIMLRLECPKLVFVAPALYFHSSNETVLRYFSPEIQIERIGINLEWQKELKVVFRHAIDKEAISRRLT